MFLLKGQQTFDLCLKSDQYKLNFVATFILKRIKLGTSNHIQDQRNYNQRKLLDFDRDQLIYLLVNKYFLDYYQAKHHNLKMLAHMQEHYQEYL